MSPAEAVPTNNALEMEPVPFNVASSTRKLLAPKWRDATRAAE